MQARTRMCVHMLCLSVSICLSVCLSLTHSPVSRARSRTLKYARAHARTHIHAQALDPANLEAAVAEMRGVPWEFAFVSRRDSCDVETRGVGGDGGDGSVGGGRGHRIDRELVISSARGVRVYTVAAD